MDDMNNTHRAAAIEVATTALTTARGSGSRAANFDDALEVVDALIDARFLE